MRTSKTKQIVNIEEFKRKLLSWAQHFDDVVWLDSNNYSQKYSNYDAVLAVDAFTAIQTDYHDAFGKLKEYQNNTNDWIFGYLTYDLKNEIEDLISENKDKLKTPLLYFFEPRYLLKIQGDSLSINRNYPEAFHIFDSINTIEILNTEKEKNKHLFYTNTTTTVLASVLKNNQNCVIKKMDF